MARDPKGYGDGLDELPDLRDAQASSPTGTRARSFDTHTGDHMTKRDLIDADAYLAANTYDPALPQDWVDDVYRLTGVYPAPLFVWIYDAEARIFGRPYPLDDYAKDLLTRYQDMSR